MICLMGCHWYQKIVFKDGVDDGLILVMLLGYDVGFEHGIKYWFIIGLFFWSEVWLKYGIEGGTVLELLLGCEYGIKYGFLIVLLLGSGVGLKYGFEDGFLIGMLLRFKYAIGVGTVLGLLLGPDFGFEDGITYRSILGLLLGYGVGSEDRLKDVGILGVLLGCGVGFEYGITYRFFSDYCFDLKFGYKLILNIDLYFECCFGFCSY